MRSVLFLILAACLMQPCFAEESHAPKGRELVDVLGFTCMFIAHFWFAVIGFFRNGLLGILAIATPLVGPIVVTFMETKATIYPWVLAVAGLVIMFINKII